MVKSLHEFEYFTVFLKYRNFTSKIKRSNVTDYAALRKEFALRGSKFFLLREVPISKRDVIVENRCLIQ